MREKKLTSNITLLYEPDEDSKTAAIVGTKYKGCKGIVIQDPVLEIPAEINGCSVVEIGDSSFRNAGIKEIVLPDTLRKINTDAFAYCKNLTKIDIPNGVFVIDANAFRECRSLESVTLPDSLRTLRSSAFVNCGIREITIPKNVGYLGSFIFGSCPSLVKVECKAQIKHLADSTFYGCTALTDVILPETLETIEANCFTACKNLQKIRFPSSLRAIGESAFSCCGFVSVDLPDSVVYISRMAFAKNESLASLHCSDHCYIEGTAFANTKLRSHVETITELAQNGYLYAPHTDGIKPTSSQSLWYIPDAITYIDGSLNEIFQPPYTYKLNGDLTISFPPCICLHENIIPSTYSHETKACTIITRTPNGSPDITHDGILYVGNIHLKTANTPLQLPSGETVQGYPILIGTDKDGNPIYGKKCLWQAMNRETGTPVYGTSYETVVQAISA